MQYRLQHILGDRLRVTDLRGKPIAMFDPRTGKEYVWWNNVWHETSLRARDKFAFAKRYGFMFP